MATAILSQVVKDIKANIDSQAEVETKLHQAKSLACIGENADFEQYSNAVIHHYLRTLLELIEQATQLSEHLSAEMCRLVSTLENLPEAA